MKLAYDDAGRGECVVLIHGHPFDRTLWGPQLAALRDGLAHAPGGPADRPPLAVTGDSNPDHAAAPWVLVEAEDKRWARVKVAESVVGAIEAGLAAGNLPVPSVPRAAVARTG